MIRFFYTVLLTLISPFLLFGLYKKKQGKPSFGHRWIEHFGRPPKLVTSQKPIWIHAVSVGETIAVTPFIKKLKELHPEQAILLTTTTSTGAEQAKKLEGVVEHRYMPLDFPFAIKRFLKVINPSQLIIVETELWLNTLYHTHRSGIPISVLNARLSQKSYQQYAKFMIFTNLVRPCISQLLCQYNSDLERFKALGFSKQQLSSTGSIKFDISVSDQALAEGNKLKHMIGTRPVWIAASTHPGEEELTLEAHKKVLKKHPSALLILVPRHPERFISVESLIGKSDLTYTTRSSQKPLNHDTQVYLGDTMGEMMALIQAADICFMGGSLAGEKIGGHNVIEPSALSKAIIIGPSYYNFNEIVTHLKNKEGIEIIANKDALTSKVISLFDEPEQASELGSAAYSVYTDSKGAIDRSIAHIENLFKIC